MSSQLDLVNALEKRGALKSVRIAAVMQKVDRGHFVETNPYEDKPKSFACNANISAPHMHAWALEHLKDHLTPGCKALDIGSGSGYMTACMAMLVGEKGCVYGIDHIPDLIKQSVICVAKSMPKAVSSGQIQFVYGDGRKGYADGGPYNAIHVGAAMPNIPQCLIDQLKPGGRLILPVGPPEGNQMYKEVHKSMNGQVKTEDIMEVMFQSLTDSKKQWAQAPDAPAKPINMHFGKDENNVVNGGAEIKGFNFNINDVLGEGSFGKVVKGYRIEDKKPVAIKILKCVNNDAKNEWKIPEMVNNPFLLKVLAQFESDNKVYVISELSVSDLEKFLGTRGGKLWKT